MDIHKVETFLCAAQTSSLTEAAKQMHLSQPAVSHHIKMLEEELEVKLFIRSNSGLKLTEAGHLLLPMARNLMKDTNELREMMSSLKNKGLSELRIACSSTSGRFILPHLVARFRTTYPDAHVKILACNPKRMVMELLNQNAHIGIVSSEPVDVELQAQEFFRDPISLVVPINHRWAGGGPIDPADLLTERVILREESSGTRKVMLEELAKFDINIEDLNVFLEVGNVEAVLELIAGGYGVSFVSELASRYLCQLKRIAIVPVHGMNMIRINYMIRKSISEPHRTRDVFWGFTHAPENKDLTHLSFALYQGMIKSPATFA